MQHQFNLQDVHLENIRNGKKVYELRIHDEKRKVVDVNDIICFNKSLKTRVIDKSLFSGYKIAILYLFFAKQQNLLLPDISSIDDAIKIYFEIYGEDNKEVVLFQLELIE